MSHYTALAAQGAQQEKAGLWLESAELWERAACHARSAENRNWAVCRAAYCRHRAEYVLHRRGVNDKTGNKKG